MSIAASSDAGPIHRRVHDDSDDRALAERVAADRDEAAFLALYRRHTSSLYAIALRLTGDRADAEDAVHDTWVRAVDALARFEWRSALRTWLAGILINRLHELERRRRPVIALDESILPSETAVDLPHDVDPIDLEAAIAALPAGYRRVLVLHDVEGFTHEEIASMLGVEVGTSKSQLSRARRHLRRALSTDEREAS